MKDLYFRGDGVPLDPETMKPMPGSGQTEHDRRVVKEAAEDAKTGLRRVQGQTETDELREALRPFVSNKATNYDRKTDEAHVQTDILIDEDVLLGLFARYSHHQTEQAIKRLLDEWGTQFPPDAAYSKYSSFIVLEVPDVEAELERIRKGEPDAE